MDNDLKDILLVGLKDDTVKDEITIILKNMAIVICRVFLFSILTMISDVFIIYIASSLNVR